MTLKSPEFLREYIRVLNEVTSYSATARRMGMDQSTIFAWHRLSKAAAERGDDPSEWLLEIEGEKKYFHQHCRTAAVGNSVQHVIANAMARARDGIWVPSMFQGRRVPARDPALIGRQWLIDMLGLEDDSLRDPVTGNVIFEMQYIPPSTDLTNFMAAANSKRYRKQSTVNVNAQVSPGGVWRWDDEKPKQVEAIPAAMIEDPSKFGPAELAEYAEIAADEAEPAPTDMSAGDTDPDALPVAPAPDEVQDLTTYTPGPNPAIKPLSEAERKILARA
jgi:hypothetical protein